jgi:hypothetical protein
MAQAAQQEQPTQVVEAVEVLARLILAQTAAQA